MSREVDVRDFTATRITTTREAELRSIASAVSDRLPGAHRVRIRSFDPLTGNAAVVASASAPAETGNYVSRALAHMQRIDQALGLTPTQAAEFAADPNVQQTTSGASAVHLQQQYKGISIYQATETVRFAPDGTLTETAGSSVTLVQELEVAPRLTAEKAVLKAAEHVAEPQADELGATDQFGEPLEPESVDLTGFEPRVVTAFSDQAAQATVLEAGPFGAEVTASLTWFWLGDDMRLAWEVAITMPSFAEQYRTLVDADNGEILYCRQTVHTVAARGNVYRVDGSDPRETTDFPRDLGDYGLPVPGNLPVAFPDDWVETDRTAGNNVRAHLGANGPTFQGQNHGAVVDFDPLDPVGDDQKVLNIFYYNCYMHDFFYLLGFNEGTGNFQSDNLGRGGRPNDRVDARAHSGAVFGTANMLTPPDGSNPVMNMGLVTSTNRHTAFDSTVVFHEFMHGVTNRLVGGPMNSHALDADQSGGMGEGWGDYIACTINDAEVVGDWVVANPGGIRGFRYDSNFPDNFGDLGTGRYSQVHNIGEIWCATLLEMNRAIGKVLGVQLVVDALKLSRANPSFLDMRDAILTALDHKLAAGQLRSGEHATARRQIWEVFARFGMGVGASSNGASLSGIVADFTEPPATDPQRVSLESTPDLDIPDDDAAGVSDSLAVDEAGRIERLAVSIDITHTWIGDLRVRLESPGGSTVTLHDGTGGSSDDLIRSFSSDDTTALAGLVGEEAEGSWTLAVADLVGLDHGTLRRWSLEIDLEAGS